MVIGGTLFIIDFFKSWIYPSTELIRIPHDNNIHIAKAIGTMYVNCRTWFDPIHHFSNWNNFSDIWHREWIWKDFYCLPHDLATEFYVIDMLPFGNGLKIWHPYVFESAYSRMDLFIQKYEPKSWVVYEWIDKGHIIYPSVNEVE